MDILNRKTIVPKRSTNVVLGSTTLIVVTLLQMLFSLQKNYHSRLMLNTDIVVDDFFNYGTLLSPDLEQLTLPESTEGSFFVTYELSQ